MNPWRWFSKMYSLGEVSMFPTLQPLCKKVMTKQRKLIQVKYPPFDTTVKTYRDIYKYEDEMTEKDNKDLKAEIFKNKQWNEKDT